MKRLINLAAGLAASMTVAAGAAHAAAAPARGLPSQWTVYSGDIEHDSAFKAPAGAAGAALNKGVTWRFAEANALKLSDKLGKDAAALGPRTAPVKTTQFLGNAVGVTVVGDVVYVESDSGYVYALNAVTGRQIWRAPVDNAAMGDPVVVDGRVFVGTGDTGFSFSQILRAQSGSRAGLVRGLSWGGIYAFDAKTGKQLWRFGTRGENMPSECYADNTLYFGNGDGHMYALDPATGTLKWKTPIGGFDSMSSCTIYQGKVFAGFTDPNDLAAVDLHSGKLVWRATFPNVANTGMGDNSPTVDPVNHQIVQVAVANARVTGGKSSVNTAVLGVDARTGKVNWKTLLGRGASPPAYKASVAMVHGGIVYVSSPVTNRLYALNGKTGAIVWQSAIPYPQVPGLGRGAVTFDNGLLYQSTGTRLFAWNAKTGALVHTLRIGGRFGIVNPVIVGNTMFVSNSWGWVFALPVATVAGSKA
ncbi:MAG: PQQ-binding-like beta-propeller repeat protein [Acidiphilium sp.]|nr:PQQ-binding-like beta-propeller repeat protein [Acidiphilium sp.]MDD4936689.1 PQQ-binding-like beta-propeller repeat protein [Acidiphilium sp.]